MDWNQTDPNLRFPHRPPPRAGPNRLIAIALGLGIFALLWESVPADTLFWLLLPLVAVLLWMASYAWRQALAALITFLERLEQL